MGILKDSGRGHLLLTRYDIYHNRTKNAIWPAEEKTRSVLDLFPELPMDGYYFEVARCENEKVTTEFEKKKNKTKDYKLTLAVFPTTRT